MTEPTTAAGRALLKWVERVEIVPDPAGLTIYDELWHNFLPAIEAEARATADATILGALGLLDVIDGVVDDTHPEGDGCPLCTALDDLRRLLADTAPAASWADERAAPPEDIRNLPFDGDTAPAEEARDG